MSSWVRERLTSSWEPRWLWHKTTCGPSGQAFGCWCTLQIMRWGTRREDAAQEEPCVGDGN